jgi:chromosome partitioning protein
MIPDLQERDSLLRKIAIINFKGGTGKTTTAVNLATGLALKGRKVLLLDNDSSGNVAVSLGIKSFKRSMYNLLVENAPIGDCIVELSRNLHVIPFDLTLADGEKFLVATGKNDILKQRLREVNDYDYAIIDNSPTANALNTNSLVFCTEVFIPASAEYLAMVGIRNMNLVLMQTKEKNPEAHISLIIPTFYDSRNSKSEKVLKELVAAFKKKVAPPIRVNVKLSEAPTAGVPIYSYAPGSHGAIDYMKLTKRVIQDE